MEPRLTGRAAARARHRGWLAAAVVTAALSPGAFAEDGAEECPTPALAIVGTIGPTSQAPGVDEIEIQSFSFGETQTGTFAAGAGAGAGKVDVHDFSITKFVDKASPKLFLACASGEHIDRVDVRVCGGAGCGTSHLLYEFTDVLVRSYQTGGSSGDCVPTENVTLTFGTLMIHYVPQATSAGLQRTGERRWTLTTPAGDGT